MGSWRKGATALAAQLWGRIMRLPQILRFAVIGTLGLVVDISVLYTMLLIGLDYVAGRFVSFAVGMTFTWYFNRIFTFHGFTDHRMLAEWARFVAANSAGGIVNMLTYMIFLRFAPVFPGAAAVAVAAGSLAGMMFNFTASRAFVFRKSS